MGIKCVPDVRNLAPGKEVERFVVSMESEYVGLECRMYVGWFWGRAVMFCGMEIHNSPVILLKSRALTHERIYCIYCRTPLDHNVPVQYGYKLFCSTIK